MERRFNYLSPACTTHGFNSSTLLQCHSRPTLPGSLLLTFRCIAQGTLPPSSSHKRVKFGTIDTPNYRHGGMHTQSSLYVQQKHNFSSRRGPLHNADKSRTPHAPNPRLVTWKRGY